jgi:hypothetical protein
VSNKAWCAALSFNNTFMDGAFTIPRAAFINFASQIREHPKHTTFGHCIFPHTQRPYKEVFDKKKYLEARYQIPGERSCQHVLFSRQTFSTERATSSSIEPE